MVEEDRRRVEGTSNAEKSANPVAGSAAAPKGSSGVLLPGEGRWGGSRKEHHLTKCLALGQNAFAKSHQGN